MKRVDIRNGFINMNRTPQWPTCQWPRIYPQHSYQRDKRGRFIPYSQYVW